MSSVAVALGMQALQAIFLVYSVLAVGHFSLQLLYAHRSYRRSRQIGPPSPTSLSVDVVVPSYNETPASLEACVRSILAQEHSAPVRAIVVDDGSRNWSTLLPVYRRLTQIGAVVIFARANRGKRHAQFRGFQRCRADLIVTVDSDTRLAPDAVARLAANFADPTVGAVTGFVDVANANENMLTRLIRLRYWMAFHQERAAQSWFGTVLCCSGPLSAYRRELIESLKERYIRQEFGGVPCTFGDDRHLTNLVLTAGHRTIFDPSARAITDVPATLRVYLRQQLRWNKSFYREIKWTIPFLASRPWYVAFDLIVQVIMPALLFLAVLSAIVFGVAIDLRYLLVYLITLTIIAGLRSTYGAIRERTASFYLFMLYGFMHAILLVPLRVVALCTLTDNRWGTRELSASGVRGVAAADMPISLS